MSNETYSVPSYHSVSHSRPTLCTVTQVPPTMIPNLYYHLERITSPLILPPSPLSDAYSKIQIAPPLPPLKKKNLSITFTSGESTPGTMIFNRGHSLLQSKKKNIQREKIMKVSTTTLLHFPPHHPYPQTQWGEAHTWRRSRQQLPSPWMLLRNPAMGVSSFNPKMYTRSTVHTG